MKNNKLKDYIDNEIIPQYDSFDKAHDSNHVYRVIDLANRFIKHPRVKYRNINKDLVYAICAYHDIGMTVDRPNHDFYSSLIFEKDKFISEYFNQLEINYGSDAITRHRSKFNGQRESIYAKVLAEADKEGIYDLDRMVERLWHYQVVHLPELKTDKERFDEMNDYIIRATSEKGKYNHSEIKIQYHIRQMKNVMEILKDPLNVQKILLYLGFIKNSIIV